MKNFITHSYNTFIYTFYEKSFKSQKVTNWSFWPLALTLTELVPLSLRTCSSTRTDRYQGRAYVDISLSTPDSRPRVASPRWHTLNSLPLSPRVVRFSRVRSLSLSLSLFSRCWPPYTFLPTLLPSMTAIRNRRCNVRVDKNQLATREGVEGSVSRV